MSRINVANFRHPDGTSDNINLDSSGQVGIGTSTASNVTGTLLTINRASAAYTQYNQGTSGGCLVGTEGANAVFYTYTGSIGSESTSLRARLDGSGNLQFNSGYGSVATAYGCRAWVAFNGSGTISIFGNGNVSSITDVATGEYTVNFATSLTDSNYSCNVTSGDTPTFNRIAMIYNGTRGTGSIKIVVVNMGFTLQDGNDVNVSIFR